MRAMQAQEARVDLAPQRALVLPEGRISVKQQHLPASAHAEPRGGPAQEGPRGVPQAAALGEAQQRGDCEQKAENGLDRLRLGLVAAAAHAQDVALVFGVALDAHPAARARDTVKICQAELLYRAQRECGQLVRGRVEVALRQAVRFVGSLKERCEGRDVLPGKSRAVPMFLERARRLARTGAAGAIGAVLAVPLVDRIHATRAHANEVDASIRRGRCAKGRGDGERGVPANEFVLQDASRNALLAKEQHAAAHGHTARVAVAPRVEDRDGGLLQ